MVVWLFNLATDKQGESMRVELYLHVVYSSRVEAEVAKLA